LTRPSGDKRIGGIQRTEASNIEVLLIEDRASDAELIEAIVGASGWEIERAGDLAEGLAGLARRRALGGPDCVLLDLKLPDATGLEALFGVLEAAPDVPIVVLSGHDDEALALEAVHTGAQDYLVKGNADGELLRRSIRYAIERRRAERHRSELVSAQRERLAAEDRAERLRRLQRLTEATAESVTSRELLASVADAVAEVLGAEWVTLVVEPRGTEVGEPRADVSRGDVLPRGIAGRAALELAARTRGRGLPETAYVRDAGELAERPDEAMLAAAVAVPLGPPDAPTGALVALRRRNAFLHDEIDLAQLVAERVSVAVERARLYEREHMVSTALQRSLLPGALPAVPGARTAVRYQPAGWGLEAGGDWYDGIEQPSGRCAFAVGDVVGRGVPAAAMMGSLRNALRAYLAEGHDPSAALARLDALVERSGPGTLATVACVAYDPRTGELEYASAGHPPPLLVPPDGPSRFLDHPLGLPIGVLPDATFEERRVTLEPGSTLLLFTDGLVEDRDLPIGDGLERLREAVATDPDLDRWLEGVVERMTARRSVDDDVAAVALQVEITAGGLLLRRGAAATELAPMRGAVREALEAAGLDGTLVDDVVLAASEAAGNVVRHAYGGAPGLLEVAMKIDADTVELTVRDQGTWRESTRPGRRGLEIMRGVMDTLDVQTGKGGTTVRMMRRPTPDARRPTP
jgi:serine phosphatase RsbU (regulator of sigma subunit)/DNA-binding response OmpR family regulator/anti-sigma regulatory factor (Ser/Thr protein kinase)